MARKTDVAWQRIFDKLALDMSQDVHVVSALELNTLGDYQARLLAKMDRLADVPEVLKASGYILVPISRTHYALVRSDNAFHPLEPAGIVKHFEPKIEFPLVTMDRNSSEMQFLDYAHLCGLIEALIGRGKLYATIRGRESSGTFSFSLSGQSVDVDRAQIEVDLGLEGDDCIILLEGKVGIPPEFNTRQLYYPFRRFQEITREKKVTKKIISIFFVHDLVSDLYHFWEYEFVDPDAYDSIQLVRQASFEISESPKILVPPQADKIEQIIKLVNGIESGITTSETMAKYMDFDVRQSSYYRQAAEELGLVVPNERPYRVSDIGYEFVNSEATRQKQMMAQLIQQYSLVDLMLKYLTQTGEITRTDIEQIVERNSYLTGETIGRRAQTIVAWLRWYGEETGEIGYSDNIFTQQNR